MTEKLSRLVLLLALSAGPQALAWAEAPADCRPGGEPLNVLTEREAIISRLEQLPESCLKDMFRGCSAAARETMLDGGSAALCSMGYEALLRRSFQGDFNALMAWWRSERTAAR